MITVEKNNSKNIMNFFITISMLLISIFPIFGKSGTKILEIFTWFTAILGIIMYLPKKGFIISKFLAFYACYIFFSAISMLWASNIGGAYVRIVDMVRTFLFMLAIFFSCDSKEDAIKYLKIYLFGVVFISLFCFIKSLSTLRGWARLGKDEFELAGQTQIYYSCILIYATIFSMYNAFTKKNAKGIYIAITIFLYICCLLTAIRKCLIVPIIFLLCYTVILNRKNIIKFLFYMCLTVIVILSMYFIVNKYFNSMAYRMNNMFENVFQDVDASKTGDSMSIRKWLRELAFEIFLNHPLIGVGIGQFRYYAAIQGVDLYSHNNFLEVLSNTGIIGFIIYYIPYISILICGIKKAKTKELDRNEGIFVISFIITTMIMEYGQVQYFQLYFLIYMCLFSYILNEKRYHLYVKG